MKMNDMKSDSMLDYLVELYKVIFTTILINSFPDMSFL